jgi:two-component sensor histidine kinase
LKAPVPTNQSERLAALRDYNVLDTAPEAAFDDIVKLASAICETPVSLISLVEDGRQWFKSKVGVDLTETPLDVSICAHAILSSDYLEVPDTTQDKRTADNPLVANDPHLRFYAGATLTTPEGIALGTICTLDYKPRRLNDFQRNALKILAGQVMKLMELRRLQKFEAEARAKAEALAKENEALMREGDHRVMNSLQLISAVLSLQAREAKSPESKELMADARNRVSAIAAVHRQLQTTGSHALVAIAPFLGNLCESMKEVAPKSVTGIEVEADDCNVPSTTASTLGLIVAELIANSFKHAYSQGVAGKIHVEFKTGAPGWKLAVCDDGVGLPDDFDPAKSHGVGMRVITSLVRRLEGHLAMESKSGQTIFSVTSENDLTQPVKESLA